MKYSLAIFRYTFALLALALASACGTTYGMYHKVQPGESLSAIAGTYGVNEDALRIINNVDGGAVEPGEQIFVPGATRQRYVRVGGGAAAPTRSAKAAPKPPKKAPPVKKQAEKQPVEVARIEDSKEAEHKGDYPFVWPAQATLTSKYGMRDGVPHDGIDLSATIGTPIFAAADGRVIYSGDEVRGYGNLIIVKHEGYYSTVYAHNDENLVSKGDFVEAGQMIARVGQTGRASGPHLHFEVRFKSKPVDPIAKLPPPGTQITTR